MPNHFLKAPLKNRLEIFSLCKCRQTSKFQTRSRYPFLKALETSDQNHYVSYGQIQHSPVTTWTTEEKV